MACWWASTVACDAGRADPPGRHDDPLAAGAVAEQVEAEQPPRRVRCLEEHRPGTVPEQDARAAVGPVQEPAQHLDADDHDVAVHPAANEAVAGGQGVQEARARGLEIEAGRARRPQLGRHEHGGRGERIVGRAGAHDDEVKLARIQAGDRQRVARRVDRQGRGRLIVGRDPALADAGARRNPFVGGVDDGRQLVIGHDPRRRVHPPAADQGIRGHRGAPWVAVGRVIVDRSRAGAACASRAFRSRRGCDGPCRRHRT